MTTDTRSRVDTPAASTATALHAAPDPQQELPDGLEHLAGVTPTELDASDAEELLALYIWQSEDPAGEFRTTQQAIASHVGLEELLDPPANQSSVDDRLPDGPHDASIEPRAQPATMEPFAQPSGATSQSPVAIVPQLPAAQPAPPKAADVVIQPAPPVKPAALASQPTPMPPFFRPHTDQTQQSPAVAASQPAPVQLVSEDPRLNVAPEYGPAQIYGPPFYIRVSNPDWRLTRLARHGAWVPEHLDPGEAFHVALVHMAAIGDVRLAFGLLAEVAAQECSVSFVLNDVRPKPSIECDTDLLEAQQACTLLQAVDIMLADLAGCMDPAEAFVDLVGSVAEETCLACAMDDVRVTAERGA